MKKAKQKKIIKKQRKIARYLETLVGCRFNKKTLKEALEIVTGCRVNLEDVSKKDDELVDFNIVFEFKSKKLKHFGYGDIYFLKMRNKGFDGAKFLVTEVAIEFENDFHVIRLT
jgi:hypothetical protein